ncbi:MAG TPA: LuxR C-terminal-related transcriptional regulator [Gaiellaceae bacterium]|nr:LuxR C-terminal-related transcriptional regulator [Gaiellaceae bacterium]
MRRNTVLARELEARGATLDDVLERLDASVTLLDVGGRVVWQNRLSVERVGDRRGARFVELMAPEYRRIAEAEFRRLIVSSDASSRREVVVVGPDGQRMRSISFALPLRDESGAVSGVLAVAVPLNWNDDVSVQPELTSRMLETLELLVNGLSTREIADVLGIAVETARNHIRSVLKRLGVHSRVAAVARARELGLVPQEPTRLVRPK